MGLLVRGFILEFGVVTNNCSVLIYGEYKHLIHIGGELDHFILICGERNFTVLSPHWWRTQLLFSYFCVHICGEHS